MHASKQPKDRPYGTLHQHSLDGTWHRCRCTFWFLNVALRLSRDCARLLSKCSAVTGTACWVHLAVKDPLSLFGSPDRCSRCINQGIPGLHCFNCCSLRIPQGRCSGAPARPTPLHIWYRSWQSPSMAASTHLHVRMQATRGRLPMVPQPRNLPRGLQ